MARHRATLAAVALAATFLAIYLPDIGHGFISDDFRWIVESRAEAPDDLVRLFGTNVGFYRPLVAVTFAVDHAVWGSYAFGYGLTNMILMLIAAALLFALARQLALPVSASLVAVGVWAFNFHAVNMAVLWISGRTALLACVFSIATAIFFIRGRIAAAGLTCLAAMLSKEEAIALPIALTAFAWLSEGRAAGVRSTWSLWAALPVYLALRIPSGAFWPTDAPAFYAFSLSPAVLGRNVLEYADRAGTLAAGVALLLAAFGRVRRSDFGPGDRTALLFAVLWIPAMFALTVMVPVRSSLYALLPSIGSAIAAGAVASTAARTRPGTFRKTAIALVVAAGLLIPVYRSRNVRWVELAELSGRVMTTLERETNGGSGGHIVLVDDLQQRFNLDSAFGALFPEAVTLRLGPGWSGEVVARGEDVPPASDLVFELAGGDLARFGER